MHVNNFKWYFIVTIISLTKYAANFYTNPPTTIYLDFCQVILAGTMVQGDTR